MSLQEKFELTVPFNPNEDKGENEWVFPVHGNSKVRDEGVVGAMHHNNKTAAEIADGKFNFLPPGMDIGNQARAKIFHSEFGLSGEKDVSGDVNMTAMEHGFKRLNLKNTDDQYSGEHQDYFYADAEGQDDTGEMYAGFLERCNYLDRA